MHSKCRNTELKTVEGKALSASKIARVATSGCQSSSLSDLPKNLTNPFDFFFFFFYPGWSHSLLKPIQQACNLRLKHRILSLVGGTAFQLDLQKEIRDAAAAVR